MIENLIHIGINAVSDLGKMENFLKEVANYIRAQPSSGTGTFSQTGHGFAAEDNEECMKAFLNIEQTYLDIMDEGVRVEAE